jgi:hypothetical protein
MARSGFRVRHAKLCEFERFAMLPYRVIPREQEARSKEQEARSKGVASEI